MITEKEKKENLRPRRRKTTEKEKEENIWRRKIFFCGGEKNGYEKGGKYVKNENIICGGEGGGERGGRGERRERGEGKSLETGRDGRLDGNRRLY